MSHLTTVRLGESSMKWAASDTDCGILAMRKSVHHDHGKNSLRFNIWKWTKRSRVTNIAAAVFVR
jgi:hypothetical protein